MIIDILVRLLIGGIPIDSLVGDVVRFKHRSMLYAPNMCLFIDDKLIELCSIFINAELNVVGERESDIVGERRLVVDIVELVNVRMNQALLDCQSLVWCKYQQP